MKLSALDEEQHRPSNDRPALRTGHLSILGVWEVQDLIYIKRASSGEECQSVKRKPVGASRLRAAFRR